jgi:regulator of sirC expression with transglutaminase-like and TPR domain
VTAPARTARFRFAEEVARPEAELNLACAALLVAAEAYPQLAVEPYLQRLDMLAERAMDRLDEERAPLLVLQAMSRLLFEEEQFRGNAEAYYDPRNSFLNDVLDRRTGIPITLSIVYLEIGWRLGLPLQGVNFPAHFLVRFEGEAIRVLVDPFHGGRISFEDQAQDLLDRAYGGAVRMQPGFLRPAGKKDILLRLLANLKGLYVNARDDASALGAIERMLLIRPDAADEVRDQGMILARLGRADAAVESLERYLDLEPAATDAARVRLLIRELREG